MSILIKGMEMPVTCCHCPLMGYDPDREWYDSLARTGAHICVLTGELIDNTKREGHCPLVHVPKHGRLIDADALADVFRGFIAMYDSCPFSQLAPTDKARRDELQAALAEVINAPTIIPAEEGKKK